MTLSTVDTDLFGATKVAPKPGEHRYDMRLEVGVKSVSETIPLVAIFHDLIKRMKAAADPDQSIDVFTATSKAFDEKSPMTSDQFKQEFKVTQSDGKQPKVLLGFKLKMTIPLSQLKQNLMQNYLIPRNLFLREHIGGFNEGMKISSFGFLKQEHPDHPDIPKLVHRFDRIIKDAWKTLDKATKTKWKEEVPMAFLNDRLSFPVNFAKERVTSETDDKPKIATPVLMVQTPKKYGQLLRELLDVAILGKQITNLIPLAFAREDPDGYYHLVAAQERFIDQHRNIQILDVPPDAPKLRGSQGDTLDQVLSSNRFITRVAYDSKMSRYHISTTATKYREIHQWISQILKEHSFSYQPTIRPMRYNPAAKTSTKYSAIFAEVVSVANESYDINSIKTTRSSPWKQRPVLDISYVPTDEAFPPLNGKKTPETTTQSTMSETLDEDTIQSAISNAIRTLQDQHRRELDALQLQFEQRMENIENKMLDLGHQVVTQTYQALASKDSPLATKADNMGLQHQIDNINSQLSQILGLLQQNRDRDTIIPHSPPRKGKRQNQCRTPEKDNPNDEFLTQDMDVTSATPDQDVGMGGCEE